MYRLFKRFFELESSSGILLLFITAIAIMAANSAAAPFYQDFVHLHLGLVLGSLTIEQTLVHWINDGLMVLFFLMVGLEIKRELLVGELSTRSQAILPGLAALGGMIVPALIFAAFNWRDPVALRGWAIPSATDIAFALGILSILGKRVPVSLKIFLTALAVIDDLGAVILIALFYTTQVKMFSLLGAAIVSGLLLFLNQRRVLDLRPYLLLGFVLWLFVLNSGVHATVAGVLLASTIPLREKGSRKASPLETLEHAIQPYVAFVIMPLFAFANAGLDLSFFTLEGLSQPIPLGLILGLFLGKQLGVLSATWLATKLAWATMPRAASWAQIYGVALLCGIGFTMSLFVGSLAYSSPDLMQQTRLGVLVGSTLSTIMGLAVLCLSTKQANSAPSPRTES